MKRRILVLTSSTGSGHDMRARAFALWVEKLYRNQVVVEVEQVIENASHIGAFGVWLYNQIQRYQPRLHNIYWRIVECFISTHRGKVSFGGRYYRQLIQDFQPDLVFSVHDSTNPGYFEDAKRIMGPNKVSCVTYCGEWTGGKGFSRNWVSHWADHFYARTEQCRQFAISLGLPPEKVSVFAPLLPPATFEQQLDPASRAIFLTNELGFKPGRLTIFLATGGQGADHHIPFLKALLPFANDIQVIAVCGQNQQLYHRIRAWQDLHPQLTLHLEGYSQRMAAFQQVSDAIVTRGGSNTMMEALFFGCVPVFHTLGGRMPQESLTIDYFLARKAAKIVHKTKDLGPIIHQWIEHPDSLRQLRTRFQELRPAKIDPAGFIRHLLHTSTTHL